MRGGNQEDITNWGYIYAGTSTPGTGPGELGDYAWYAPNSFDLGSSHKDCGAHPVGTKAANSKDLYDMTGNVQEMCWDWYATIVSTTVTNPAGPASGSYRVFRGGNWGINASGCAFSSRSHDSPDDRYPSSMAWRLVS